MDEIIFHASQRLEAFQIHFQSGLQNVRHTIHGYSQAVANSFNNSRFQENIERSWDVVYSFVLDMKKNVDPRKLYSQIIQLVGNDGGASFYYAIVGFAIGGLVGVTVGLTFKRPPFISQKMKAIVCNNYDGIDNVEICEIQTPTIRRADEVLVNVKAGSVDSIDIRIASGYGRTLRKQVSKYNPNTRGEFPVILGRDGAGVIVEIGNKVKNFDIGDEVWFMVPHWLPGTLAEYIVLNESMLAKKPKGIRFEIAAGMPYAGMIAWDAMVNRADLTTKSCPGKRILVHAGTTAVGCLLVQLSRLWGAHVTTTCSLRATPVAQALGADDIIVCDQLDVERILQRTERFDVVFNTVGAVAHEMCLQFCNSDGLVVTTVTAPIPSDTYGLLLGSAYSLCLQFKCLLKSIFGSNSWGTASTSIMVLEQLGHLIENGSLQPVVDKIFAPEDAELAFQHVDSLDAIGKTIIRFRSTSATKGSKRSSRAQIQQTSSAPVPTS